MISVRITAEVCQQGSCRAAAIFFWNKVSTFNLHLRLSGGGVVSAYEIKQLGHLWLIDLFTHSVVAILSP